ncbi:hypothetical protein L873DRAFT_1796841 [Choiromyces venosus 120613-1]|uniref:Uncharacterized protein n=1 Tax=Choiromyces venosus 120613-1 TaxID=1336337 RepID=A0A3N4K5Y0_9PEZI|nr:hypothetical protein L873DRAFT_1796841 [Choiromyces venosus 120613-1]
MNWPELGLFRISSTKKTKLLGIFEKKRYLAYHQFQKLRRLQTVLVQAGSLTTRFYGSIIQIPSSIPKRSPQIIKK